MKDIFTPPTPLSLPVWASPKQVFPHRIYCLVRNYPAHAREMGHTGLEDPFFFLKPVDKQALIIAEEGKTVGLSYPSMTKDLHHEIELVLVIGEGGKNIKIEDAYKHIYGYALGLDMTRRDLQIEAEEKSRPWCIAKAFDHSAVIGPITPVDKVGFIEETEIYLTVNGEERQRCKVAERIWNTNKTITQLSKAWELQPGDLIYTGTPSGTSTLSLGDRLSGVATTANLTPIHVHIS
jgi:fumarylpyruvate hydrolase